MSKVYSTTELLNLKIVNAAYENVLDPLDADAVDNYFREDYRQHSPMAEDGSVGLKNFLKWAKANSPNARHYIKRMFADGDHVIVHLNVIIEPGTPGNAVIDIFRLENGRIAEHWDVNQTLPDDKALASRMF